jgi:hypothetical protein
LDTSNAEPHHFYAAPNENFEAAPAALTSTTLLFTVASKNIMSDNLFSSGYEYGNENVNTPRKNNKIIQVVTF